MGRILIEFILPALLMAYFGFKLTKFWYQKIFPKQIEEVRDITEHSEKYDKKLTKIKWNKK